MADDLHFGKNELLARCADAAVLANKLVPSAALDVVTILGSRCVVDTAAGIVTLNSKPLPDGLAEEIEKRAHWRPQQAPDKAQEIRSELEASALAGNLTAAGKLRRELGAEGFAAWQEKTGARLGKPAINKDSIERKNNPFSAEGWNVTKQASLVRSLGLEKANQIATAAGVRVGATKPARAA